MMRFLIAVIINILLATTVGIFVPYWGVTIATFVTAVIIRQKPIPSFVSGFLAVFILWCVLALWIDNSNHHILSARVSHLFYLSGSSSLLIILTGVVGGILGGMGAITGSYLHREK